MKSFQPAQLADILVNSPLYAHDLILVSESGSGFQNCLKKLQTYCDKWKLKVNTKKIQNNEDWEKTISPIWGKIFIRKNTNWRMQVLHTYLGTVISSNEKFKANMQQLCKITSRLMYTLLSHTNKCLVGNTKLLMDLFDKIILPICTYNSEVWGSAFFTKQYSRHSFFIWKWTEKPSRENTNTSWC